MVSFCFSGLFVFIERRHDRVCGDHRIFLGLRLFSSQFIFIYAVFLCCLSSYKYMEQIVLLENPERHFIQRQPAGSACSRVCRLSSRVWGVYRKGYFKLYGVTKLSGTSS